MITLRQLRIFWAVAHAGSITKAGKLLGLAQPSLSQQISKLEKTVGTQLFNRNRTRMELTDAGHFLFRKAELVLAGVDEAMAGLQEFAHGTRGVIAVGALSSLARNLIPRAVTLMAKDFAEVEVDIHEVAPAESLELLYGRRLNMALLATDSIASSSTAFRQTEVFSDPYVLAVPSGIDLSRVRDVMTDLPARERAVINSTIQFNFGTQHARRIAEWYQRVLPHYRVAAQSRTYEVALSMVQAGLGVAVVPALTAAIGPDGGFGVTLYRTCLPDRNIVCLMPSQYLRIEPYSSFVKALEKAGKQTRLPSIRPMPPLMGGL